MRNISPEELFDKKQKYLSLPLSERSKQTLIHFDVRDPSELKEDGYIANSVNVPLKYLSDRQLPDNKEAQLVFSCKSGGRSLKASKLAEELGYTNIFNLEGGFTQWKATGKPVLSQFKRQPFVKCFYDEPTGTCQYLVTCEETKETVIIDPVLDFNQQKWQIFYKNADKLISFVKQHDLNVTWILETHAHADHLTSSQYLKTQLNNIPKIAIGEGITLVQKTFAKIFGMEDSEISLSGKEFDHLFKSEERFNLGNIPVKVLNVPGHTPDHLCYLIGESLFVGDSIFMPDSGSARCDFPGGSADQLYESIKNVLFSLPDDTRVFVGHDYMPDGRNLVFESTIGEEKAANKHVKMDVSKNEFVKMREERDKTLDNPKLLFASLQVNIKAGLLPSRKSVDGRPLFIFPVQIS